MLHERAERVDAAPAAASQAHTELCERVGETLTAYFPRPQETENVQAVDERIAAPFAFTGAARQAACTALEGEHEAIGACSQNLLDPCGPLAAGRVPSLRYGAYDPSGSHNLHAVPDDVAARGPAFGPPAEDDNAGGKEAKRWYAAVCAGALGTSVVRGKRCVVFLAYRYGRRMPQYLGGAALRGTCLGRVLV